MLGRSVKPHDNTGLKAVLNLHTCNSKLKKKDLGMKRALHVKNLSRAPVDLLHDGHISFLECCLLQKHMHLSNAMKNTDIQ